MEMSVVAGIVRRIAVMSDMGRKTCLKIHIQSFGHHSIGLCCDRCCGVMGLISGSKRMRVGVTIQSLSEFHSLPGAHITISFHTFLFNYSLSDLECLTRIFDEIGSRSGAVRRLLKLI